MLKKDLSHQLAEQAPQRNTRLERKVNELSLFTECLLYDEMGTCHKFITSLSF
jgi:hypothetical protein